MQGSGGVQVDRQTARLTTQSICGQGSWESPWDSGRPGRTPQTGTHCPGPWDGGGRDPSSVSFASDPGAFSGLTHGPFLSLCPHADTRRGLAAQKGGRAGIPVVLRCVLVCQHLQVDGLRPPLDAPVLGPSRPREGEEEMEPGAYCLFPPLPPT